jgi:hypothetical protein
MHWSIYCSIIKSSLVIIVSWYWIWWPDLVSLLPLWWLVQNFKISSQPLLCLSHYNFKMNKTHSTFFKASSKIISKLGCCSLCCLCFFSTFLLLSSWREFARLSESLSLDSCFGIENVSGSFLLKASNWVLDSGIGAKFQNVKFATIIRRNIIRHSFLWRQIICNW